MQADLIARLNRALADRYRSERELAKAAWRRSFWRKTSSINARSP